VIRLKRMFTTVSSCEAYGPLFFAEPPVIVINYLDMLQLWIMPQLQEDSEDLTSQQDGAQPHFHFDVRAHLNANLADRWIGHASENDSPLLPWPPRSPDLRSCDVSLCGYIKDRVYVIPIPRDLPQLPQRIARCCNVCCRNLISRLTSAASPRENISSTCFFV
jgi:hypothetical protein